MNVRGEGGRSEPLVAYRIDGRDKAILTILALAAKVPVLGDTSLARMYASVSGAVERGHYFLVRHGSTPVGYMGYGLCDEAVVRKHLASNTVPPSALCQNGETVLIFDIHARDPRTTIFIGRTLRKLFPGRRFAGIRTKNANRTHRHGRFGRQPQPTP